MTAPSINAPVITVHPRVKLYATEALRLALSLLLCAEVLALMVMVLGCRSGCACWQRGRCSPHRRRWRGGPAS